MMFFKIIDRYQQTCCHLIVCERYKLLLKTENKNIFLVEVDTSNHTLTFLQKYESLPTFVVHWDKKERLIHDKQDDDDKENYNRIK